VLVRETSSELGVDVTTLRAVAFGRESLAAAEGDGRLIVTGDRRSAERFTRMFPVAQVNSKELLK